MENDPSLLRIAYNFVSYSLFMNYNILSHRRYMIIIIIEPFRVPVDWKGMGLFDYPTLIKKPMDLGTAKRNINARKYKSIPEAAGKFNFCFV